MGDMMYIYLLGLIVVFNFSITSTTILPFIISLTNDDIGTFAYALQLSLTAISQVISGVVAGSLAKKYSMKWILFSFQIIVAFGALLYCFAGWPLNSVWAIVISRFLAGAQGGTLGLATSYISKVKEDKQERTIAIANFRGACILGVFPSSVIAGILTLIPSIGIGSYELNSYVTPSWVNLFLQLAGILICLFGVQSIESSKDSHQSPPVKGMYISTGVILIFVIFLFFGYALTSMNYLMPVVLIEGYGWSASQYSIVVILFSIMGISGSLSVRVIVRKLGNYIHFAIVPLIGAISVCIVISSVGIVAENYMRELSAAIVFVIGIVTSFFFFSIANSILQSSFTTIIPPEYVVSMMPLTNSVYAVGKILGPLICEVEMQLMGAGLVYFVFFITAIFIFFLTLAMSHHFHSSPTQVISVEEVNTPLTDSQKLIVLKK